MPPRFPLILSLSKDVQLRCSSKMRESDSLAGGAKGRVLRRQARMKSMIQAEDGARSPLAGRGSRDGDKSRRCRGSPAGLFARCRARTPPASPSRKATAFTQVCESDQSLAEDLDQRPASFDKLRMRDFLRAMKISPHPELVEGRTVIVQPPPRLRVQ